MNYPEGLSDWAYCHMEGCIGKGNCPRCGKVNYALLGWYGAVARWAKAWGVSEKEAERRIIDKQNAEPLSSEAKAKKVEARP